jgi:hypothetical protein
MEKPAVLERLAKAVYAALESQVAQAHTVVKSPPAPTVSKTEEKLESTVAELGSTASLG